MSFSLQKKDNFRYEILELPLGTNPRAGRSTYKALDKETEQLVVIKQFQFLNAENWTGYKSVEREIQILKNLDHPNIPKYLDFFETDDGICLVQEYIDAPHLIPELGYSLNEIESIVRQILEVLDYLQLQNPIVIHRDIKPENILFNRQTNNVYLVDFGLAKGSNEEIGNSTTLAGTFGFMAPELLHNKSFPASDLYALGITLVSLLWKIPSKNMSDYINWENSSLKWQELENISEVSKDWIKWLKKLTEPNFQSRVSTAEEALTLFEKRSQKRIQKPTKKAIAIGLSVVAVVGVGVLGRQFLIQPINTVEKTHDITLPKPVVKPKQKPKPQSENSKPPVIKRDRFEEYRQLISLTKQLLIVTTSLGFFGVIIYVFYQTNYQREPISIVLDSIIGFFIFAGGVIVILFVMSIV